MNATAEFPDAGIHPPVTVLIATYERVELAGRALRSVWSQDYEGIVDVTVVCDAPLPPGATLPQPSSPRHSLRVVDNQGASGCAGSRYYGLSLGTHELVAVLDDDDEWLPAKLREQVAVAVAHPGFAAIGGGIQIVTPRGAQPPRRAYDEVHFADLLESRITELHTSTLLMRRAALDEVGAWDLAIPGAFGEDYDLLLRLTRAFGAIYLAPSTVAVVHWDNVSFFRDRWVTGGKALEYLLEKFPEFAAAPAGRARIRGQIAYARAVNKDRRGAWQWARAAWSDNWREPRATIAMLVASGVVSPGFVQRALNGVGRGI